MIDGIAENQTTAMEFEQARAIVNKTVAAKTGRHLTEIEIAILTGAWNNFTYEQIADLSGYSLSYLQRDIGPKFWKLLSQSFGRKLTKTNVREVLIQEGVAEAEDEKPQQPVHSLFPNVYCDWGEAGDVSVFYGRTAEISTLRQWIVDDRCRLVAVLGMGGIGKTSLSIKLAQQIVGHGNQENTNHHSPCPFEFVIWRSLRNAPPLKTLLADLVLFLSHQQDTLAEPGRLLYYLQTHRCLLMLDNVETILQSGDRAGYFQPDYENYGELLKLLGESSHQSCILFTSREKPAEVAVIESDDAWVRSFRLYGSHEAALALIEAKGLIGTDADKQQLCKHYSYSPLALKIVATSIQSLFDGEIAAFLQENTTVFNGLRHLLDKQFERLSELEKTIMYWLAINRESTSITELIADLVPPEPRAALLESLESLNWRSLIESNSEGYTQQPVVMEYMIDLLTEQVVNELINQDLALFQNHALVKTTVKDYVIETQKRLIIGKIANLLIHQLKISEKIEQTIKEILFQLQASTKQALFPSYAAGNLINLCHYLQLDLTGYDFSDLKIRHACLQKSNLHRVSFFNSEFIQSTFTQTLEVVLCVAFNPTGTLLATGEGSGQIRLWRVGDGQALNVLSDVTTWVVSVQFSPDGSLLAAGYSDYQIRLWDVQTGSLLNTFTGHQGSVWSVRFSPDGNVLASGSGDRSIKLWDVQTGQVLNTLHGHTNQVQSVDFSSDGRFLASGSLDQTVRVWDVQNASLLKSWIVPTGAVLSLRFSPDDRYLATGNTDHTIKLWDVQTEQLWQTFQGHHESVWSVRFSPNGQFLASSANGVVKLWNVATGQLLKT